MMQNKLLSFVPEYLPLGLILYDKDGYVNFANNMALKMFGVLLHDICGLNIYDDPNILTADKVLLKQGRDVSFETDYDFDRCRTQFAKTSTIKERKYFRTRINSVRDEAGEAQGFLLTCEDVTEQKEQEQKIMDAYHQIRATQRELSMALDAGRLTSWYYQIDSKLLLKLGSRGSRSVIKSFDAIRERVHPDDNKRFETLLEDAIRKNDHADNSIILRIMDEEHKQYRYFNFIYSVSNNDKGDAEGITFIQRDVTEEMEYQHNLIMAKEKAEEADKLKSTFLATMSHEIRTPLNAIVGFSQLLSDTTEDEERSEYKQLIETNSEILLKLIGDILDLSKIEAGSVDINRQTLDLTQLCRELYLSFQQRIRNSKVTLKLVDPYQTCKVRFDRHRFIQIFTNFVTNAIKYTPQGEIVMGYECSPGRVRFYVKDTGIGISEQKKCRIFSRFEKLDDFAQGSGLGLSICKAIADATGAQIGFTSKEGEGSEFWYEGYTEVEYVERTQHTTAVDEVKNETQTTMLANNIQNLNILVAEDNDSNYLLMKNILKGDRLTRAVTGDEAVEKMHQQQFDVVFMDMKMPIMDGLEATMLIREFDRKTPIIALTANAFNVDREAALAAGCNYFMTKPVKKQEITDLLSKLWIIDQQ
ncbi:MAG: response regulator [Alistipes sp.]